MRSTTLLLAALLAGCGARERGRPAPEQPAVVPNTPVPPGPEEIAPGTWGDPPRDDAGALVPRWTFCPEAGAFGWKAVVAAGRSYAIESRDHASPYLVSSLGREGEPRFSTPVAIPALYGPSRLLLAGGLVILVHDQAAEAFRMEDGSSAWTVELSA